MAQLNVEAEDLPLNDMIYLLKSLVLRISFVVVILFQSCFCMCKAQSVSTNSVMKNIGISASGQYFPHDPGGAGVSILVHFAPPNTNISIPPFPEVDWTNNHAVVLSDPFRDGRYFRPTNSFCGFVELRDATGHKIKLLKPEVNSPEAYPASYGLSLMRRLLARSVGDGPELPLVISGMNAEVSFIHLKDYFKLKKPGVYQLTVWPKIYKRFSQTNDICQRIDVPSIIIPIHWEVSLSPKFGPVAK